MKTYKKVIDILGNEVPRKECIIYRKNYYHINHPDVYFIEDLNKHYHFSKLIRDNSFDFGVISYDKNNKTFTLGFFLKDPTKMEQIYFKCTKDLVFINKGKIFQYDTAIVYIKDVKEILYDSDFIFNKANSKFYYIGNITDQESFIEQIKEETSSSIATHRAYNIEDNSDYQESVLLYNKSNIEIEKTTYKYKKYLKNYTFGIELETSEGSVYRHSLKKYGFSICRDGSIDNAEYVSVPMSGLKGIESIKKFMNLNANNVNTDINCSLHVHIGNIRNDKVFINALYNFLYYFQHDYFSYFPYYKKENVLNKRKHYTKPLPPLCKNISFNKIDKKEFEYLVNYNNKNIFLFLTDGIASCKNFNKKNKKHPLKNKWDRVNRYYVFNFMNLLFSSRNTIEFRIHENTFNSNRVINQILLSIAIFEFVQDHIKECLEGHVFTVMDVINYYFKDEVKKELIYYYNNRKNLFFTDKLSTFASYTNNHYANT
jgi:hypothetical protein